MASEDGLDPMEDREEVPLHHLKPFGSGLYRKKIAFVPAASGDLHSTDASVGPPGKAVGDLYLSMVLSKGTKNEETTTAAHKDSTNEEPAGLTCEICKLPMTSSPREPAPENGDAERPNTAHEASLVHQVCLTHSHPPSALDRSRMGLSVLASQGWDPDSRQGLGASGQGIQFPVKAVPKDNKLGIGVVVPKGIDLTKKKEKPQQLDAKKVRKMVLEDRKRTQRLQEQLFGNPDLERYLGTGSGGQV